MKIYKMNWDFQEILFLLQRIINFLYSIFVERPYFESILIMSKTKYSNQLSQFLQKSPEELEELSQSNPGDAFLDNMLKKFDEHISK
jgi:hypothetical protein